MPRQWRSCRPASTFWCPRTLAPVFHISGPADVLDAVRERLAGKPVAVTYTTSADCDVRIVAGQATLETRLGDWLAQLNEAVP